MRNWPSWSACRIAHRFAALALAGALAAGCGSAPSPPSRASAPVGVAAAFPEHTAGSLAALGWPGARRAFQVGEGSVVWTGEVALAWALDSTSGPARVSPIQFETDGVPVAHWTLTGRDVALTFEAAAAPVAALGETSLVASVRVTATSTAARPESIGFTVRLGSRPEGTSFVPWDAPAGDAHDEAWHGREALRDGRLVALFDHGAEHAATPAPVHTRGERSGALVAHCGARLAPGAHRHWDFLLPLYPTALDPEELARDAGHDVVTAHARGDWRAVLERATALATGDTLVDAAWDAALVTLVTCQEREAGRWVPIGNPFQYRDTWLRDGARVVRALAVANLGDYARDDARTLAEYELPSGALLSQNGQLDCTGQALWAFAQACELVGDRAFAAKLLPVGRHALDWLARQRRETAALGLPWGGLLPFADPRDAELARAELVGNDAWGIAGCDAVASLAERAGDAETAARARQEAADYRARFAAALAARHAADVPPTWRDVPARDWGNLSAGYPTWALPPGDPRLAALTRRVLAPEGRPGLSRYGGLDSLHTYNGADLAIGALFAGDARWARAWRDSLLAHSTSTLGQAEILDRRGGGYGPNLPPHATAAAALVDLLRSMLVVERGDTLLVAAGTDSAAWTRGATLSRAPTRFGVVSLQLDRPAPGSLRARLDPIGVPLLVRVPDGCVAVAVRSPGASLASPQWVEVAPRTREVRFDVAPARGAAR